MKIGIGGKLRKTHEHELNRQLGTATLVRVNPTRDYGRNLDWKDGKGEKIGETERVIVQRLHGTDIHYFFTGDGEPLSRKAVPKYILEDIKKKPLVSEMGGSVDTVCICKVCGEPQPTSLYSQHLEAHLLGTAGEDPPEGGPEFVETDDEQDEDDAEVEDAQALAPVPSKRPARGKK